MNLGKMKITYKTEFVIIYYCTDIFPQKSKLCKL